MVLETMSENFRSLRRKLNPWDAPEVNLRTTLRFRKHYDMLNLREIGLFHSFRLFEVNIVISVIIVIRFGENIVIRHIYIDIYINFG